MGDRRYPSPVRRDEESEVELWVPLQKPKQAAQRAPLKVATALICRLRRSGKNVVDRHDDRGRPAGTIPLDWSQLFIIKNESPPQLLRRAELPIVHAGFLNFRRRPLR